MPKIKIKGKTIHLPYPKKGKVKWKKKKKAPYGQIPTGSGPENPIGGN